MKGKLKKFLALALVAVMTVSMAGCGKDDGGKGDKTDKNDTPTVSDGGITGGEEDTPDTPDTPNTGDQADKEETYDFGGVTVKAWGASGAIGDLSKEEPDKKFLDAQQYVNEKYNIKYETVKLDGHDGGNEVELLMSSVAAGDPAADIVTISTSSLMSGIKNNLYAELTPYLDEFKVGSAYTDAMSWDGKCYGISFDNIGDTWMMLYNRDMLKQIGMEKTPTQMFMEGKWDYQSFKDYLAEMKSKLPEGTYPIGIHPFHWATMAGAANGATILDSTGHLSYMDEPFIEAIEFYKELLESGLAAPPEKTVTDDGTESYNYPFTLDDPTIVLKRVESWQYGGVEYDFGIVPWPWGSNVTCEGDYTTLSDNYKVSLPYWGGIAIMASAPERTGIPADVLMKIQQDYEDAANGKEWMKKAYEAEKAGEQPIFNASPGSKDSFSTDEDVEIRDWVHSHFVLDWSWTFDNAELIKVWKPFYDIYGSGKDVRSTLESYYNEAQTTLKDAGYAK